MHYFIKIMHELQFHEGYYGQKYSDQLPQAILEGVHYDRGSLKFQFKRPNGEIIEKNTRDPLEMLVLSEILYGSELWKYKASISDYHSYHSNRKCVSILVEPDESYVSTYKDTSVGFKVYLSTLYDKLKSYGGYDSYPKVRDISYPSYLVPIEQPPNFKVELFEYQKKSIAKMLAIERGTINLECNYNYPMEFGETMINYNPRVGKGEDNDVICQLKIKTNGGILADEMGLGKTITSLAVVALNPSTYNEQYKRNLLYSNATLIVCPSHLSKQWESEVKRIFPKAKIIKLLTKNNHANLTYKEMKDADIIIVTQQFLMNFKYYPQVHYQYCTPSNFTFSSRITKLSEVLRGWRDDEAIDIMKQTQPNLEHFNFHRLIVDEGHEIFGLQLTNASMAKYMAEWLDQVNSDYKWFVSGTPFVNYEGLKKCLKFVNMTLIDSVSGQDFSNQPYVNKAYIIDKILGNIMIRHRKCDVDNQIQIPGYEEEVIWVKLTELEKNLYNSKKNNHVSDITLQQLCCHILISDTTSKYFGSNTEVDLSQMQDQLIEYHRNTIVTYEKKLECLKPENQAYAMVKKNYQTKVSESKYMLSILEKMAKKDEIDLNQNCSICFDTLSNPSLTPCGHIFCKDCLEMCLQVKKECPMCKADLAGKEIYLVDSKKEEAEPEEENPLIKKYGSKLGKLISIVRTLISDDKNRIIIFSQWDRMLNLIGKSLSDNGVANSFVKGNVWSRNSAISKFKLGKDSSGEDNKVIMLSLSNSASGTNLTEATHIIFVEPINQKNEEVKAIEGQAVGRACRLGQKNKIKVIRILTQNTIEEEIYDKIYSKNMDNIKRTIMVDDGNLENNIIV
jgi:SWI/SNF-related matrix-associated actin-dependent regulator of chromatin subfamily A3